MLDQKQAYQSAKKELDEESRRKLIDQMKVYIKGTLQAIEGVKEDIAIKQQELKALKADLTDLENGHLDKIKERQDKDEVAKRVSIINITYIVNSYPWVVPYFQPIYHYYTPQPSYIVSGTGIVDGIGRGSTIKVQDGGNIGYCYANNTLSPSLNNVNNVMDQLYSVNDISGTYTVECPNGKIKAFYM